MSAREKKSINSNPGRQNLSFMYEPNIRSNKSSHDKGWICAIFTSFAIFVACVSFIFLSNIYGIFGVTIKTVADDPRYKLLISPASRTFSIWGVIYTLLFCVHLYSLVTICRRGKVGYLYLSPGMISKRLLLQLSLSYIFSCAWQVLFLLHDQVKSTIYSTVALVIVALLNYMALSNAQSRNRRAMIHNAPPLSLVSKKENIIYQMLVVNSVALYFGWTLVAANLAAGISLQEFVLKDTKNTQSEYEKKSSVAFTVLILFTVCAAIYGVLDYSMLGMTVFTILQYASILVGLIGILYGAKNENSYEYEGQELDDSVIYKSVNTFPKKQLVLILVTLIGVFASIKISLCLFSFI